MTGFKTWLIECAMLAPWVFIILILVAMVVVVIAPVAYLAMR